MIPETYRVLHRWLPTGGHQQISGRLSVLSRMITTWFITFVCSRMGVLASIECWFLWSFFCCMWQGATFLRCLLVPSLSAFFSLQDSFSVAG